MMRNDSGSDQAVTRFHKDKYLRYCRLECYEDIDLVWAKAEGVRAEP